MLIKKLRLKNGFKRFHDLTIDLGDEPSRIIALVGPNGCGKSSVFDGMTKLSMDYGSQLGNTGGKPGSFYSMKGIDSFAVHENVEIDFGSHSFSEMYGEKKKLGTGSTIFSFRNSYRYNSNLDVKSISALPDLKSNSYGASTSIDIDDRMIQNYQRLFIKYSELLEKDENMTSGEAKKVVIEGLNSHIKECLDLKIDNLGNIQAGKGKLYFSKQGYEDTFDFNVLSAGEKEVVDIIIDLYLRKDDYNDTIYIIDEPELHLNTAIQRKLLIEINKIIPDNCQIWIATHSIGFLKALQDELNTQSSIIFFNEIEKLATDVVTLQPMVKTHQNWKKIFATALEDLTGLLSPQRIIYCEGRKDPDIGGGEQGLDPIEFEGFIKQAGLNTFLMSPKKWIAGVHATGIISKSGRYGGTFAHKDIALEFANWISVEFRLFFIKEFQRLKEQAMSTRDWSVKRFLTKMNYKIHTDAIKDHLIPASLTNKQITVVYADEADLLNVALFGQTAKERRDKNPHNKETMRDNATIEQLIVLANIESINAEYIKLGLSQSQRLGLLNKTAISQMKSLLDTTAIKKLSEQ